MDPLLCLVYALAVCYSWPTNMHEYTDASKPAPGPPTWYTVVKAEGNGFHFSLMPVCQGGMAGQRFITAAQQGPRVSCRDSLCCCRPIKHTQLYPALFIKVSIYRQIMITQDGAMEQDTGLLCAARLTLPLKKASCLSRVHRRHRPRSWA